MRYRKSILPFAHLGVDLVVPEEALIIGSILRIEVTSTKLFSSIYGDTACSPKGRSDISGFV